MKLNFITQQKDYLLLPNEKGIIKEGDLVWDEKEKRIEVATHTTVICQDSTSNVHKLLIAYKPLSKDANPLNLPMLPDLPSEEEDVEKLAVKRFPMDGIVKIGETQDKRKIWIDGYKAKQSDKKYVEVIEQLNLLGLIDWYKSDFKTNKKLAEHLHSLNTPKTPKGFVLSDKFETLKENIKNGTYTF